MNITTKSRIVPILQRKKRGDQLTDPEMQVVRAAAVEVADSEFKDLLQNACNEPTPRLRRQAGKELLNRIKFATGARKANDLPPNNPRPKNVKRILKSLAHVFLAALTIVLSGWATAPAQRPARSDVDYSETRYAPDVFRLHFDGSRYAPVERSTHSLGHLF